MIRLTRGRAVSPRRQPLFFRLLVLVAALLTGVLGIYCYAGTYGINVLLRRGTSVWLPIAADDQRISPAMRLALSEPAPAARAGQLEWRSVARGFEVAELPVIAAGSVVDQILLARIDPARYRFQVHNAPAGNREPADWLKALGAVLVINGSYFSRYGRPTTPVISHGQSLGPSNYDAQHGGFVANATSAAVVDLAREDWHQVFAGATHAMVSYPLLLAADGTRRAKGDRRWLANRSFVGQDGAGRVVLGTTRDGFFSLERFAAFLQRAPIGLRIALNLDGGPVACQGISIGDFHRDFCGKWETDVQDGQLRLLAPLIGRRRWGLPIVLAVSSKELP
ncbi:MAG TPA: phosphodiester glycosidase family protein [Thermoanaerobaculia bacterium]|nr:phosphodiester glycosidase family protein [Thermoanaerobaculia bacterium]